jgi:hypothetical protein
VLPGECDSQALVALRIAASDGRYARYSDANSCRLALRTEYELATDKSKTLSQIEHELRKGDR